jgi:hypothetical protein
MPKGKATGKPVGRPTSYRPEFVDDALKLCGRMGATDDDLAFWFGVSDFAIKTWRGKYPEFAAACETGKAEANAKVKRALFQRACGYSHDAEQILAPSGVGRKPIVVPYRKHYPPETVACIFWLKNRDGAEWRDVQDHKHGGSDGGPIQITISKDDANL